MSLERDTTAIKELVEAGLFKPATPEQVANRRPPRSPGEDICPHCKADLRGENNGVYESQTVSETVGIYWEEHRQAWEYSDTEAGNIHHVGYFCNKCDGKLKNKVDFDKEGML